MYASSGPVLLLTFIKFIAIYCCPLHAVDQCHCHVLLHTHLLAAALPPASTRFLVPTCQYQYGCKMMRFCFATDLQQLCMALSGKADTYHLAAILVLSANSMLHVGSISAEHPLPGFC